MKKIKYLPILLCIFTACKKNNCDNPATVTGKWEWVRSVGGLAGINNTPQNTGRNWQLLFNQDLSVVQTGDLLDDDSGTYSLTQEMNGSSTINYLNVYFSNYSYKYKYYLLPPDTLKLEDHIEVDGLTYYFVKR